MRKIFYLSLVYDLNGYDRLDLEHNSSLKALDEKINNFDNSTDIKEAYLNGYNMSRKGKICLLFEDLDEKERQLNIYNNSSSQDKERIKKLFSYVHIIPIMYKNRNLLDFASCMQVLKSSLHKLKVQLAIVKNEVTNNNDVIQSNKMYLFDTEEERDLILNLSKYKEAIEIFLDNLMTKSDEEKYFVCRSLMRVCHLYSSTIKTKYGKLVVYDSIKDKRKKSLTKTEIFEEESKNMDDFYTYHDLDEVIKYSPDEKRPIGSEGRMKI